jgi:hypothetical protein
MALDSTFTEKFKTDALSAKSLGQRDAWGIAMGAAMSAGLPMFIQGEPDCLRIDRAELISSSHELGGNAIHPGGTYELCPNAPGL